MADSDGNTGGFNVEQDVLEFKRISVLQQYDNNIEVEDMRNQLYKYQWQGMPHQDLHRKLSNLERTLLRDSSFRTANGSRRSSPNHQQNINTQKLESHLEKINHRLPVSYHSKIMNLLKNQESSEFLKEQQEKEIKLLEAKKLKIKSKNQQLENEIKDEELRLKRLNVEGAIWDERCLISKKHMILLFGKKQ